MYSYNFVVKQTGYGEWTIFTDKGVVLHIMNRISNVAEVTSRANAWASSWNSASIKVEDEQVD